MKKFAIIVSAVFAKDINQSDFVAFFQSSPSRTAQYGVLKQMLEFYNFQKQQPLTATVS